MSIISGTSSLIILKQTITHKTLYFPQKIFKRDQKTVVSWRRKNAYVLLVAVGLQSKSDAHWTKSNKQMTSNVALNICNCKCIMLYTFRMRATLLYVRFERISISLSPFAHLFGSLVRCFVCTATSETGGCLHFTEFSTKTNSNEIYSHRIRRILVTQRLINLQLKRKESKRYKKLHL